MGRITARGLGRVSEARPTPWARLDPPREIANSSWPDPWSCEYLLTRPDSTLTLFKTSWPISWVGPRPVKIPAKYGIFFYCLESVAERQKSRRVYRIHITSNSFFGRLFVPCFVIVRPCRLSYSKECRSASLLVLLSSGSGICRSIVSRVAPSLSLPLSSLTHRLHFDARWLPENWPWKTRLCWCRHKKHPVGIYINS